MAKTKGKVGFSDDVRKRRKDKSASEKTNPFELKVNRQKHDIMGRKATKFDHGRPGVSRMKAMDKRTKTLLAEYKQRNKANMVVDRRIGEDDTGLLQEEKSLKRFAHEKKRKSQLFNLADDDELTHYGQRLSEVERFDDPIVSDEDDEDDEDRGKIGADIVSDEHFGGGMLSMKPAGDEEKREKSWKERMEEVIAKSKKAKYERQMEREQTVSLTEKLDARWKELRISLAASLPRADKEQRKLGSANDEYDTLVRELQFESRSQPTDKLKSEAEIAMEEKKRLEKLEQDRLRRMKGITDDASSNAPAHISADSLEDNFYMEMDTKPAGKKNSEEDGSGDGSEEESGDEEESEGEGDSNEGSDSGSGDEEMEAGSDAGNSASNNEEVDSDAGDDSEAALSDAEGSAASLDAEDEKEEVEGDDSDDVDIREKPSAKKDANNAVSKRADQKPSTIKANGQAEKTIEAIILEAEKQLPFTFKVPATFKDFESILQPHSDSDCVTIITRMIKCHHVSLDAGNRAKLEVLYGYLLRYYCCSLLGGGESPSRPGLLDPLVRPLFDLTQQLKMAAASIVMALLSEFQSSFSSNCNAVDGLGRFPGISELLLLKLISLLFPTSDFQHPVVTPAMLFMSQILTRCPVHTCRDVAVGLFVCNLYLEYTSLSKRLVPEAICFLSGVVSLAFSDTQKQSAGVQKLVFHPFKASGKRSHILHPVSDPRLTGTVDLKPVPITFLMADTTGTVSDEIRLSLLNQAVSTLYSFAQQYETLSSFAELFLSSLSLCSSLLSSASWLPQHTKDTLSQLIEFINKTSAKTRRSLTFHTRKVAPLKQHEPRIVENFDGKKKRATGSAADQKRLVHKYRREMKGAVREIRRDNDFLARHRLGEQMKLDADRKRKVKDIYHQLATQEGEVRALKRIKDRL